MIQTTRGLALQSETQLIMKSLADGGGGVRTRRGARGKYANAGDGLAGKVAAGLVGVNDHIGRGQHGRALHADFTHEEPDPSIILRGQHRGHDRDQRGQTRPAA